MTDSTLCYHCHKPLVDGACPDPIVVKSIKRLQSELEVERTAEKIQRDKAIASHTEVAELRAEQIDGLVANVRDDINKFSSGGNTLDRENILDLISALDALRRDVNIREIRMRQAEARQEAAETHNGLLRAQNEQLELHLKIGLAGIQAENRRLGEENDRLRAERDIYVNAAQQEIENLREALKQILEDPDALIRDSHRDDGWEAIGEYEKDA